MKLKKRARKGGQSCRLIDKTFNKPSAPPRLCYCASNHGVSHAGAAIDLPTGFFAQLSETDCSSSDTTLCRQPHPTPADPNPPFLSSQSLSPPVQAEEDRRRPSKGPHTHNTSDTRLSRRPGHARTSYCPAAAGTRRSGGR